MEQIRYSRVARLLHWGVGLLILANLAGGFLHDANPQFIMPLHKATGILILALTVIRILWRLTHPAPALPAAMPMWERATASFTHALMYALMVLIPLSGWVLASAGDRPLSFYGLFDVMKFSVEKSEAFKHVMEERHEQLSFALIALLVLHTVAALRHHFLLKDGLLARMLR